LREGENVNSSLELQREVGELNRTVNEFPRCDREMKTMKKSSMFFCNNEYFNNEDTCLKS
jgi:hypothetical protein